MAMNFEPSEAHNSIALRDGTFLHPAVPRPPRRSNERCHDIVAVGSDRVWAIFSSPPPPNPNEGEADEAEQRLWQAHRESFAVARLSSDATWDPVETPTAFHCLSIGADGAAWAVDYQRAVFSLQRVPGGATVAWERIGSQPLLRVAVGDQQTVWGVSEASEPLFWAPGNGGGSGHGSHWVAVSDSEGTNLSVQHISVAGDGSVWAIEGTAGRVWLRVDARRGSCGMRWVPMDAGHVPVVALTHADRYSVFAVAKDEGKLLRRCGLSAEKPRWCGTHWQEIILWSARGAAAPPPWYKGLRQVSCAADGSVWGIGDAGAGGDCTLDLTGACKRAILWPGRQPAQPSTAISTTHGEVAEAIEALLDAHGSCGDSEQHSLTAAFKQGSELFLDAAIVLDASIIHTLLGRDAVTLVLAADPKRDIPRRAVAFRLRCGRTLDIELTLRISRRSPDAASRPTIIEAAVVAIPAHPPRTHPTASLFPPTRSFLERFGAALPATRAPSGLLKEIPFAPINSYSARVLREKRPLRTVAIETQMWVLGAQRCVTVEFFGHRDALSGTTVIVCELPPDVRFSDAQLDGDLDSIDQVLRRFSRALPCGHAVRRRWLTLASHPAEIGLTCNKQRGALQGAVGATVPAGACLLVELTNAVDGELTKVVFAGQQSAIVTLSLEALFPDPGWHARAQAAFSSPPLLYRLPLARVGGMEEVACLGCGRVLLELSDNDSFSRVALDCFLHFPGAGKYVPAFCSHGVMTFGGSESTTSSFIGHFAGDCGALTAIHADLCGGVVPMALYCEQVKCTGVDVPKKELAGEIHVAGRLTMGGLSFTDAHLRIGDHDGTLLLRARCGTFDTPRDAAHLILALDAKGALRMPPPTEVLFDRVLGFLQGFVFLEGVVEVSLAQRESITFRSDRAAMFFGHDAAVEMRVESCGSTSERSISVELSAALSHPIVFGDDSVQGGCVALKRNSRDELDAPQGPEFRVALGEAHAQAKGRGVLRFSNDPRGCAGGDGHDGSVQAQMLLFRVCSNFADVPFHVDGVSFPTVEHFLQAKKFLNSPSDFEAVIATPTPHDAVKYILCAGERVRGDWKDLREEFLAHALKCKFEQHRSLALSLIATGDAELIFESSDQFWGVSGESGEGKNVLGQALMARRSELKRSALGLWQVAPAPGTTAHILGGVVELGAATVGFPGSPPSHHHHHHQRQCHRYDADTSALQMSGSLSIGTGIEFAVSLAVDPLPPAQEVVHSLAMLAGVSMPRVQISERTAPTPGLSRLDRSVIRVWGVIRSVTDLEHQLKALITRAVSSVISWAAATVRDIHDRIRNEELRMGSFVEAVDRAETAASESALEVKHFTDESVALQSELAALEERIAAAERREADKPAKAEWFAMERFQLEAQRDALGQRLGKVFRELSRISCGPLSEATLSGAAATRGADVAAASRNALAAEAALAESLHTMSEGALAESLTSGWSIREAFFEGTATSARLGGAGSSMSFAAVLLQQQCAKRADEESQAVVMLCRSLIPTASPPGAGERLPFSTAAAFETLVLLPIARDILGSTAAHRDVEPVIVEAVIAHLMSSRESQIAI